MTDRDELRALVAREADHSADFAAFCRICEGAWPGSIRDLLASINTPGARRLLSSSRTVRGTIVSDRRLPLPHLLDADWRFTRDSAEAVLDALFVTSDADVLVVGMPTVALAAQDRGLSSRIVVASRPGEPTDMALRSSLRGVRFVDLRRLPAGAFRAAAIDPPWYNDIATPLIDAARRAIAPKGTLLVCAPDRFTFPSQAGGLVALVTAPEQKGFSASKTVARLRYATPFFELRTLEAIGIRNVSPAWRTGRLIACEVGAHPDSSGRSIPIASDWRESRVGPVRVWMRRSVCGADGPTSIGTVDSISRTHPSRANAQIWTSGNLIATGLPIAGAGRACDVSLDALVGQARERLDVAIREETDAIRRAITFV